MCSSPRRSVAVGFFDGVHVGHRLILGMADAALTFRNHPLSVLAPERVPRLLMGVEHRLRTIGRLVRTHRVLALDFTAELAAMPPEDFARRVFFPASNPDGLRVICGENWRFGKGGTGDAEMLKAMGLEVVVVPSAIVGDTMVSSTRIREELAAGHPENALPMLGRNYTVTGKVFTGKGVGTEMGFPTVNFDIGDSPLKTGVYVVKVEGTRAIANFGIAPTFGDQAWDHPILEVHFFNSRTLNYVEFVDDVTEVSFQRYLRPERKFASVDELASQIDQDVMAAKATSQVRWGYANTIT